MKKIQAAQWADPLCRLNRRRASSTALALMALLLTTARDATPDEGLQEALEGKVTPEGTSTSKGESTTGGGSEAVSPHH